MLNNINKNILVFLNISGAIYIHCKLLEMKNNEYLKNHNSNVIDKQDKNIQMLNNILLGYTGMIILTAGIKTCLILNNM